MKNMTRGDESFEEILEQLDKVQIALSKREILLKVFQAQKDAEGMQDLIDQIVRIFHQPVISSIRCVVQSPYYLSNSLLYIGKTGSHADDFAYLDGQISDLLNSKSPLIITDTTKNHSIKFDPDKPFPKAIVACELSANHQFFGFLWMGYDETIHITPDEFGFYQEISGVISLVLKINYSLLEKTVTNEVAFTSLDRADFPFIIFIDQMMVYSNQQAEQIIHQWNREQKPLVFSDDEILPRLQEMDKKPDQFLRIGRNEYDVIIVEKKENSSTIYAVAFLNRTRENRRQEATAVIIESVGHSLRSTISHCLANLKMLSLIGDLNSNQLSYLENSREALNEAKQVIDDLALIDRLSDQKGLFINDFSPGSVIRRVIDLMKQKTRQKRIEIRYQESSPQNQITTDQSLFTQSIINLLDFTLERSRMGGIITLDEQFDQDGWKFMIIDASRGMAQSELDELTSSKEKWEKNKEYHIARRIIRYLGGNLTINNNLGYGCQFIINIQEIKK